MIIAHNVSKVNEVWFSEKQNTLLLRQSISFYVVKFKVLSNTFSKLENPVKYGVLGDLVLFPLVAGICALNNFV